MVTESTKLGIIFWIALGVFTSSLSILWLGAFLSNYPLLSTSVSGNQLVSTPLAIGVDVALLALFGVQHSIMPRAFFKAWIERFMHPVSGRGLYNTASGLVLIAVCFYWQPLDGHLWQIDGLAAYGFWAVFGVGVGLAGIATIVIGGGELLGLPQAQAILAGKPPFQDSFRTPFLYRLVRHPMQLGIILMLFGSPDMSYGRLLFSITMTVYIWVGVTFEERSLVVAFGDEYRRYQREVPKLLPFPRP